MIILVSKRMATQLCSVLGFFEMVPRLASNSKDSFTFLCLPNAGTKGMCHIYSQEQLHFLSIFLFFIYWGRGVVTVRVRGNRSPGAGIISRYKLPEVGPGK